MRTVDNLKFDEFAARYCERQKSTPKGLFKTLMAQKARFNPEGWFMLECRMLDSSSMGQLVIVAYGPNNTFKTVPTHPVSPRGLASDMSVAVAQLSAEEVT